MESLQIAHDKPALKKAHSSLNKAHRILIYFDITLVIIRCFIAYDAHLFHCAYTIVGSVFNTILRVLLCYQKHNLRGFNINLGVIMKPVAFES